MLRALIVIAVVVGFLVGGLLVLRRTGAAGMPDKDVLQRVAEREREQRRRDGAD